MQGLGEAQRLDDAFELLEKIESGTAPGRVELTDVHLNTLVNACAHAGQNHAQLFQTVVEALCMHIRGEEGGNKYAEDIC
jgi:hypothetical protein